MKLTDLCTKISKSTEPQVRATINISFAVDKKEQFGEWKMAMILMKGILPPLIN